MLRAVTQFWSAVRITFKSDLDDHASEKLPTSLPKIRALTRFSRGYPNLAAFHSSDESFMVYRQFSYLQARVLLEKQDELRTLEEELDVFDEENVGCASSRQANTKTGSAIQARKDLLGRIDLALSSYTTALANAQQLMGFNKPTGTEQCSVSAYLENHKPVKIHERAYINYVNDLVTLRAGREHAWLDRTIERILQSVQGPFPFVHRVFCSKATLQITGGSGNFEDVHYYTRKRIDLCAVVLITIAILALLIVPIWLLYHIVTDNEGILSGRGNAVCIGTLLVSTLLFSAVLSLFTRARRHEILAAAAAYCAVLVVFLGNVRPV